MKIKRSVRKILVLAVIPALALLMFGARYGHGYLNQGFSTVPVTVTAAAADSSDDALAKKIGEAKLLLDKKDLTETEKAKLSEAVRAAEKTAGKVNPSKAEVYAAFYGLDRTVKEMQTAPDKGGGKSLDALFIGLGTGGIILGLGGITLGTYFIIRLCRKGISI